MEPSKLYTLLTNDFHLVAAVNTSHFTYIQELRAQSIAHYYPTLQHTQAYRDYLFSEQDHQSQLYLIYHPNSCSYVGTVRIFYLHTDSSQQILPMTKDCAVIPSYSCPDRPICEISRLILAPNLPMHPDFSQLELRMGLVLGLMTAIRVNMIVHRYQYVYAFLEPSLHRLLQRFHIYMEPLGEAVEYYGKRMPCGAPSQKLLESTQQNMAALTEHYIDILYPEFNT
jgi:hypothetical protein